MTTDGAWEYLTKIADNDIPAIPMIIMTNGCFSINFILCILAYVIVAKLL
ncbi:MAG: hypothetical protein ACLTW9_30620 [Enterocloster sp.]